MQTGRRIECIVIANITDEKKLSSSVKRGNSVETRTRTEIEANIRESRLNETKLRPQHWSRLLRFLPDRIDHTYNLRSRHHSLLLTVMTDCNNFLNTVTYFLKTPISCSLLVMVTFCQLCLLKKWWWWWWWWWWWSLASDISRGTNWLSEMTVGHTFWPVTHVTHQSIDPWPAWLVTRDSRLLTSHDSRLLQFPVRTTKWKCFQNHTSSLLQNTP